MDIFLRHYMLFHRECTSNFLVLVLLARTTPVALIICSRDYTICVSDIYGMSFF